MSITMNFVLFTSFISFIIYCSSQTTTTGSRNWWCTQTPHYETCDHYLTNRNLSKTTITINEFLDMTVEAAIDEARVVLTRAQDIESKFPNVPGKSLWGSCVDYFDGIVFTLNMVLDHTLQPTPLDVQTWLSAGLANINLCEKGFELINMTNTLLPTISTNLTELILNSLAISVVIRGDTDTDTPRFIDWNNFNDEFKMLILKEERPDIVVAQDGSGDYKTIQEAVDNRGKGTRGRRFVIYVKAGVYEENVVIPKDGWYIKMFGDGINKTIITADRHAGGDMLTTPKAGDLKSSATFRKFMYLLLTFWLLSYSKKIK